MLLLRNLKIGAKLMVGFGLLLALMLGVGLYALERLGAMRDTVDDLRSNWMASVHHLADIDRNTADYRLVQLIGENVAGADVAARHAGTIQDSTRTLIIAVLIAALVAGMLLALVIARSLTRPAGALAAGAARLAEGDLSQRFDYESTDE